MTFLLSFKQALLYECELFSKSNYWTQLLFTGIIYFYRHVILLSSLYKHIAINVLPAFCNSFQ